MSASPPTRHWAVVLGPDASKQSQQGHWCSAELQQVSLDTLVRDPAEAVVVVKISAFSFNHRDLWIRKGLYPIITPGAILGSDCAGHVVHPPNHPLHGTLVLVYPALNWIKDPSGPDVPGKPFGILGGSEETNGIGTFAEYISVPESHCVPSPPHLAAELASAIPLAALTAFRAVFTKGDVMLGTKVLITGIGGGVALFALQFCLARGATVWVTSSSQDKIDRACRLGATGGVNYTDDAWPTTLAKQLQDRNSSIDLVIDSGGGAIAQQACKGILREGGRIVNFGATGGRSLALTMNEVLKNIELRGSTMGSLAEFKQMVQFISDNKIEPIVYKVLAGFDKVEEGFHIMRRGEQFGKVVVSLWEDHKAKI